MKKKPKQTAAQSAKIHKVLHEAKEGTLHSGSKHGPVVTSHDQALAIAMSEAGIPKKAKKIVHHSPAMLQVDCSNLRQDTIVED